jgi:hypothetical protein
MSAAMTDNPLSGRPVDTEACVSYTRRLSDKVLIAFHLACDQGDIEIARHLLDVLEFVLQRLPAFPDGGERRVAENLAASHKRLWQMQHSDC